ncbi:MAG: serine/threonine-protein phosphatase [Clostridium sp.]|jgi:serine/threonine protein phosphatase PrpC|nr:serine/threonine-protein phosphatase [Clostridium sp.]
MEEILSEQHYIVVLLCLLIILVLLLIRYRLRIVRIFPKVSVGNAQIIGSREEQEDSFATAENNNAIMAVLADGMGGYSNGKMVSSMVVQTFVQEFTNAVNVHPVENFFINAANLSNRAVLDRAKGKMMGSTVVSVVISDGCLQWVSIGDSAIILFRDGELINLNKKHTYKSVLEDQYISGLISEEQLINNPRQKRVTSYIGAEILKDIEISEKPIKLKFGDKVILCSDGVYNSLSEIELEKILSKSSQPFETAEKIMQTIEEKNYSKQDNATIIVLSCN